MMDIKKIKRLPLKDVFGKEDEKFTPWLEKHLNLLSDAVGIPMVNPQREVKLENLRPDIIAYTEPVDGDEVIIENQYDKSDSYHVGKLLSYAAYEKRARYAILVTESAREEHIEAIKALNEKKVCDCSFFLVNANCYQIEGSPFAIGFDVIVGDEIIKEVSESKQTLSEFWSFFVKRAKLQNVAMYAKRSKGKNTDNWLNGFIGKSHAHFVARVSKTCASIAFWLSSDNAKINSQNFNILCQYKEKINADFGKGLLWVNNEQRKSCKIECYVKDVKGYSDRNEWQNITDAMLDVVKRMDNAFSEYYDLLV